MGQAFEHGAQGHLMNQKTRRNVISAVKWKRLMGLWNGEDKDSIYTAVSHYRLSDLQVVLDLQYPLKTRVVTCISPRLFTQ